MINKKIGQVWIETVLYTLIGLSLIGLVLAFVTPRINDAKDKGIVEQSIDSLKAFDDKVRAVTDTPGNVRVFEFNIKRGEFYINSSSNDLIFIIDGLRKPYSEPGIEIKKKGVSIVSLEGQKESKVILSVYYGKIDLTFNGNEESKKFSAAAMPYKFYVKGKGSIGNKYKVDISI